jgi:ABC-type Fe3+-hydroxamate transport system substrate-binding protein
VSPLVQDIGTELVGAAAATEFQRALTRPLAKIGGSSRGMFRPRVAAVVSLDPLLVAGGHSFETDLIEIAGGQSVTHPGEENRIALEADAWRTLAPDLILVVVDAAPSPEQEAAVRNTLPSTQRIDFFEFRGDDFWLDAPAEPASRLRALIAERSREMQPDP